MANSNWTSSNFGDMTFQTSDVNFTVFVNPYTLTSWTCHISSGDKYVIRSVFTGEVFGEVSYFYYCFDLRRQSADSYLFYLQSPEIISGFRIYTKNITLSVSVSEVCSITLDVAEYHVMMKSASPSTVKTNCASPLLADFTYDCSPSTNDTGTISTCPDRTSFTFNNTVCSSTDKVLWSDQGEFNCIASTSTTISGDTVYYQTLYNLDTNTPDDVTTFRYVCMAVQKYSNSTVIFSATETTCVARQNATYNTLYTLTPTVTCPIIIAEEQTTDNTGMTVGIVVGVVIAIIIIIGVLIFYFCFYKKDPNAGKPIVENTKPRFEDPDKDDIIEDLELVDSMASPVTRDEITFEAMSPSIISNGRLRQPVRLSPTDMHGGTYANTNGIANGSIRRDSGIAMTEKSLDRPTPRIGLNQETEAMVIFNGEENVISGNDTRIIPIENPNARTLHMDTSGRGGTLTLQGLEDDEEMDVLGEMSDRENMPYPSLPREKSNLMPPIETSDPEKDGR
ncbi:hypothetical protein ACF0H5_022083 [Mactra antiquata]